MVSNKVAGFFCLVCWGIFVVVFVSLVCCGFCLFVVVLGGFVCLVFCGVFWGFFDDDFLVPLEIPLLQQRCTKA